MEFGRIEERIVVLYCKQKVAYLVSRAKLGICDDSKVIEMDIIGVRRESKRNEEERNEEETNECLGLLLVC